MKPNGSDLLFWQSLRTPKWAASLDTHIPKRASLLHSAINRRARLPYPTEPHNALIGLRHARSLGSSLRGYMVTTMLASLKLQPQRAVTYRRWLCRMEKR